MKIHDESKKKIVWDTATYLAFIEEIIDENKDVVLPVVGGSMSPFLIHERDHVYLGSIKNKKLHIGNIILYQRNDGRYILHRICKIKQGLYFTMGDAQSIIEGPLSHDQIIAVVKAVKRKGQWYQNNAPVSIFFSVFWSRCHRSRKYLRHIMMFYIRLKKYFSKN